MADVTSDVTNIRGAILGIDVRESIAKGIEDINTEVISTTAKENALESRQNIVETVSNQAMVNEPIRIEKEIIRVANESERVTSFAGMVHVDANLELSNARGGEIDLDTRLDKVDSSLANIPTQMNSRGLNILYPPIPLVACKTDGTDNTAILQNLINYAQDNGTSLYIPSGIFSTTGTVTITKRLKIFGDGMGVSKIRYSGVGSAIEIKPPTDRSLNQNTFYSFRDFGVEPLVIGSGTHGIDIILELNAYFSNWEFDKVYFGDFGGYGLHFNNDIQNGDGFFMGTIRRCWIWNGINGSYMGDSLTISENTITGKNTGISFSCMVGATQVIIRENNITTSSGFIVVTGATQPSIKNNQMECLNTYLGATASEVFLLDTSFADIDGNTITAYNSVALPDSVPPNYVIYIGGNSQRNKISKNLITTKDSNNHICFDGVNAYDNIIAEDNRYDGFSNAKLRINNNGGYNTGIVIPLIPLNYWVNDVNVPATVKKSDNGLVIFSGRIKDGTVDAYTVLFTIPVGFRPLTEKRFLVGTMNGTTLTNAILVVGINGDVISLQPISNTLLLLDSIQFTLD